MKIMDVECSRLNIYYINNLVRMRGINEKEKTELLRHMKSPGLKAQISITPGEGFRDDEIGLIGCLYKSACNKNCYFIREI